MAKDSEPKEPIDRSRELHLAAKQFCDQNHLLPSITDNNINSLSNDDYINLAYDIAGKFREMLSSGDPTRCVAYLLALGGDMPMFLVPQADQGRLLAGLKASNINVPPELRLLSQDPAIVELIDVAVSTTDGFDIVSNKDENGQYIARTNIKNGLFLKFYRKLFSDDILPEDEDIDESDNMDDDLEREIYEKRKKFKEDVEKAGIDLEALYKANKDADANTKSGLFIINRADENTPIPEEGLSVKLAHDYLRTLRQQQIAPASSPRRFRRPPRHRH